MRSHTTSSSSSSSSSSSVFSRRTTAYVHTQNWTNATLPCSTTSPHATTIITVKHSNNMNINKNYFLSNSSSVQCNFFIFDHVTFIQFKICCCVQNFVEIRWYDFSLKYGDVMISKKRPSAILYFRELLFKSNEKKFSFRRVESMKIGSHLRRDLL